MPVLYEPIAHSGVRDRDPAAAPDWLDRAAVAYLLLPLAVFLGGWLQWWAAVPLLLLLALCVRPLVARGIAPPVASAWQLVLASGMACAWTAVSGIDHLVFSNADWYVRDAVFHDLVTAQWPVGYGSADGSPTILRSAIAYFLPAALAGKGVGLPAAHALLLLWTAIGVGLFLVQVLSITRADRGSAVLVLLVTVLFSGMDFVGEILSRGERFLHHWHMAEHLEWWARDYQYSSLTTQLFWVPNHALGAWLATALCLRRQASAWLARVAPILLVGATLWSPLSALGLAPYLIWIAIRQMRFERSLALLHPGVWLPALALGFAVVGYVTLDGTTVQGSWSGGDRDPLRILQFFLLEAGAAGFLILAIRRDGAMLLALAILLILPWFYLGPANDLVMRTSIPSLVVLAVCAAKALLVAPVDVKARRLRAGLGLVLAAGAITPLSELARAVSLPRWPFSIDATLASVNCGALPPHYVAQWREHGAGLLLKPPHVVASPGNSSGSCRNPAIDLMLKGGLL